MKFIPFSDRVLVRPDPPKQQETRGLAKPQAQEEKPTTGVVLAMGPIAFDRAMIGRRVHWNPYSGREIEVEGEKLLLLRWDELNGKIEE